MVYSVIPSENVAWISCGEGNSKYATFAFSVSILCAKRYFFPFGWEPHICNTDCPFVFYKGVFLQPTASSFKAVAILYPQILFLDSYCIRYTWATLF